MYLTRAQRYRRVRTKGTINYEAIKVSSVIDKSSSLKSIISFNNKLALILGADKHRAPQLKANSVKLLK